MVMKYILLIVAGTYASPEDCERAKAPLTPKAEVVLYECRQIAGPAPLQAPMPKRKPEAAG